MSTYVLVHGAWHGAWSWYKIIPRLERAGHQVIAPDLPGLGTDTTPPSQVTLQSWVDFVCAILDAQSGPVIVVGHSRAGIVISEVAEQRPERIRALVYVTAFLPRNGESMSQLIESGPSSIISSNVVVEESRRCCSVRPEALREGFYGCCTDEDFTLARLLLRPEPVVPMVTPLSLSERFAGVPRLYIECLRDQAVPLALQKRMHTAWPGTRCVSIDTDHSPFLSRPDELAKHLLGVGS